MRKRKLRRMLDMEIQEYDGYKFGYFKSEYRERIKWMYIAGILSKKQ